MGHIYPILKAHTQTCLIQQEHKLNNFKHGPYFVNLILRDVMLSLCVEAC